MKKIKDIESALHEYENLCHQIGTANEKGDYKTNNKCFRNLWKTAEYLRELNALDRLKTFWSSSSAWLRFYAAFHLLWTDETEAKNIIKQIVLDLSHPILSHIAEYTLIEWEKGNIKWLIYK